MELPEFHHYFKVNGEVKMAINNIIMILLNQDCERMHQLEKYRKKKFKWYLTDMP